ncbi:hypothetical protein Tdes44962_MAKER08483 [Teratosphaeria destructans]|uniref:Fungal N-terminal domain-containing protein n=1 Tax=Teratosphaeria destructans TaxID=418781 RepID=A0A9W7W4F6_9PEZI|nr:hypothetical protein Tdes44962_MAKER08483 [Teratosphaeria destructans]
MAEAFGVAAGVVGVAGFAIQLAESVVKLKDFCSRVKGAPEELDEIVNGLQQSSNLLDRIANQQSSFAAVDRSLVDHSLTICSGAIKRIKAEADRLDADMRHRRLRASVKLALKEKEMDRLLLKLDRAKADLHHAYTIWSTSQLHLGQKQLAHDIASMTLVQTVTAHPTSEVVDVKAVGSVRMRKPRGRKGDAQKYTLRLPTWLYSQAWEMSFQRAASGWDFSLKSYRILPTMGSVYDICREGDLDNMKVLIGRKGLSIFDRFENGGTLLSVRSSDDTALVASQQEIWMLARPLQQWSMAEKLGFIKTHLLNRPYDTAWSVQVARIQIDILDCEIAKNGPTVLTHADGFNVLHAIAWCFDPNGEPDSLDAWFPMIAKAVEADVDLHSRWEIRGHHFSIWKMDALCNLWSPLTLFIYNVLRWARGNKDAWVQRWVAMLQKAGVDLEQYGIHERAGVESWMRDYRRGEVIGGLARGPNVSDWSFWYEHPGDEHCGLFGEMIEHPERAIPGAWQGDHNDTLETCGATKQDAWERGRRAGDRFRTRVSRQKQGWKTTWTPDPVDEREKDGQMRHRLLGKLWDTGPWTTQSWLEAHRTPNDVLRLTSVDASSSSINTQLFRTIIHLLNLTQLRHVADLSLPVTLRPVRRKDSTPWKLILRTACAVVFAREVAQPIDVAVAGPGIWAIHCVFAEYDYRVKIDQRGHLVGRRKTLLTLPRVFENAPT